MLLDSKPKGEMELHTCDNHDKSEDEIDGEEGAMSDSTREPMPRPGAVNG